MINSLPEPRCQPEKYFSPLRNPSIFYLTVATPCYFLFSDALTAEGYMFICLLLPAIFLRLYPLVLFIFTEFTFILLLCKCCELLLSLAHNHTQNKTKIVINISIQTSLTCLFIIHVSFKGAQ